MQNRNAVQEVVEGVFVVVVVVDELPDQGAEERLVDRQSFEEGLRVEAAGGVEEQVFHRKLEEVEVPVPLDALQLLQLGCR